MKELKRFFHERYEWIIPIFHYLLSFLRLKKIFIFSEDPEFLMKVVPTARSENILSLDTELRLVFVLSSLCSFLIILGLWRLIFFAAKKTVSKSDRIVLGCILLVGLLVGLVLYPSFYGWEYDNYSNFLMARRFIPSYWHSIYTGVVYAGCLMVLPHPIALFLFQWLSFWAVVSYIYLGIRRLYGNGIRKYLVLLLFLLPESYYVTYNPYRNNLYTILVLFYFSISISAQKAQTGTRGFGTFCSFLC